MYCTEYFNSLFVCMHCFIYLSIFYGQIVISFINSLHRLNVYGLVAFANLLKSISIKVNLGQFSGRRALLLLPEVGGAGRADATT